MNKYKVTLECGEQMTVTAAGFVVEKGSLDFYSDFDVENQVNRARPENICSTFRRSSVIAFWPESMDRDMTHEYGIGELFK